MREWLEAARDLFMIMLIAILITGFFVSMFLLIGFFVRLFS